MNYSASLHHQITKIFICAVVTVAATFMVKYDFNLFDLNIFIIISKIRKRHKHNDVQDISKEIPKYVYSTKDWNSNDMANGKILNKKDVDSNS